MRGGAYVSCGNCLLNLLSVLLYLVAASKGLLTDCKDTCPPLTSAADFLLLSGHCPPHPRRLSPASRYFPLVNRSLPTSSSLPHLSVSPSLHLFDLCTKSSLASLLGRAGVVFEQTRGLGVTLVLIRATSLQEAAWGNRSLSLRNKLRGGKGT